ARGARAAFPAWRAVDGETRRRLLHQIADAIVARAEEIALVESIDTGQPIRYMSKAALRAAENFRFFADRAPGARDGLSLPTDTHVNYTMRTPIGPPGIITPWNTPFMLPPWKIAPALAAGCTVVHKPAEWSPLSAVILVELMHDVLTRAGPPGGTLDRGARPRGLSGSPPPGARSWRRARRRSSGCTSSWEERTPSWYSRTPIWSARST